MDYNEIVNTITATILKQVKKALDTRSHSDKTFKAKITGQSGPGKYQILYCQNSYTVSSTIPCNNQDTVRVCAPCNNWQDLFVVENITGGKRL
ncbi:MAG: hypothetical protein HFG78_00415 [Hungatella sp.]|nr:hypothetical protein [Hungatella sp.]MCI9636932.1 hypothetical protein [Hungatella sp.]